MPDMDITVIIPFYMGHAWIDEAVRSAVSAGVREVIVVDDGSPMPLDADRLRGNRTSSVQRLTIVRQENRGVAEARNRGSKEASSSTILFLDQDDSLNKTGLKQLYEDLQATRSVAAVGRCEFIGADGNPLAVAPPDLLLARRVSDGRRMVSRPSYARITARELLYRNCIYTPAQVLLRRSEFQVVGGFDESVAPNDDWDMWFRLSTRGPLTVANIAVARVRRHGDNVSLNDKVMRTMEIALRRKFLCSCFVPAGEVGYAYRTSERNFARDWWGFSLQRSEDGRRVKFAWEMRARSALFFIWSVVGLRAHVTLRKLFRRLTDPRKKT